MLLASACAAAAAGCGRPGYDSVAGTYSVVGSWEIARPDGTSEFGPVTTAEIQVGRVRNGHAQMTFVGVCGDTAKCSPFTMEAKVDGHEGDGTVFDVAGTVRLPAGTFVTSSDGDNDGNAAIDDSSIRIDLLADADDGRVFRASLTGGAPVPPR